MDYKENNGSDNLSDSAQSLFTDTGMPVVRPGVGTWLAKMYKRPVIYPGGRTEADAARERVEGVNPNYLHESLIALRALSGRDLSADEEEIAMLAINAAHEVMQRASQNNTISLAEKLLDDPDGVPGSIEEVKGMLGARLGDDAVGYMTTIERFQERYQEVHEKCRALRLELQLRQAAEAGRSSTLGEHYMYEIVMGAARVADKFKMGNGEPDPEVFGIMERFCQTLARIDGLLCEERADSALTEAHMRQLVDENDTLREENMALREEIAAVSRTDFDGVLEEGREFVGEDAYQNLIGANRNDNSRGCDTIVPF